MLTDLINLVIDPGVEPGLRADRRHMRGGIEIGGLWQCAALGECRKLFGIQLLDHPEAAELALGAIEVSVVVGIASNELIATDMVAGLDALDHMHRNR